MSDNFGFREHEPDRDERPRCRECDDAGCPACDAEIRDQSKLLEFRGAEGAETTYAGVRQQGSLTGELAGVGGIGASIPIILEVEGSQLANIYANRALAKDLAPLLFEPVRLHGQGTWERDSEGVWALKSFRVDSFERLENTPLTTAVAELRELVGDLGPDAYNEVLSLRREAGIQSAQGIVQNAVHDKRTFEG